MLEVSRGNKRITMHFSSKKDEDDYSDYLNNGLKMIGKDSATKVYYFNDGSRLFDVSMKTDTSKRYVLRTLSGRTITSPKLQKKYTALV